MEARIEIRMESRQFEDHARAFEPIQSHDHISTHSELTDKDFGPSKSWLNQTTQSSEKHLIEETRQSSQETCQAKGSTETDESQVSFTGEDVLQNVSAIEHSNTSDNLINAAEFDSWMDSISKTTQEIDQGDSGIIEDDVSMENGSSCILVDIETDDMVESPSILDDSHISESRNPIEFGSDEISPMKCPIFRTELGGATVTECGLCMCSHCFSQRKADLDELCNVCGITISSHHIVEMEKASENILRSHYLTIEQLEDYDMNLTQEVIKKQEEIEEEQSQNQRLQAELYDAKQEVRYLKGEIENLQQFKTLCCTQAKELRIYRENIVPSKDKVIEELRNEVTKLTGHLQEKHKETEQLMNHIGTLNDEIANLRRVTIPINQLEVLTGGNLCRAVQQLQYFYDRDYRSRHDITDKMEILLQTRLESVTNELCQQQAIGDQLATVIMTYTSMVLENANLHQGLRRNQDKIRDLQAELRHTKARIISPRETIRYF
ncbi:uncharacterized protein LOC132718993 [Ruditapes philippinarum]|uniref:uncharacterized protein LOC132718993 n=1 Tax=Ruditapes philippinarum TaxID=129788 RepID=UPI00295BAAD1|nr:uncharacterized protein LOC132718993 [Ruditapes philippinarum]